jgi:hypothetical protein
MTSEIKTTCGACARIGTNDTSGPQAHTPDCPETRRKPITLAEANAIEGYARALVSACVKVDRAARSTGGPASRRMRNHAAMDRDVALRNLADAVLAAASRTTGRLTFVDHSPCTITRVPCLRWRDEPHLRLGQISMVGAIAGEGWLVMAETTAPSAEGRRVLEALQHPHEIARETAERCAAAVLATVGVDPTHTLTPASPSYIQRDKKGT